MMSVAELFDTIYTYIISISGIIAFGSLLIGGFLYLSSAGEPEQMSKAKKQILSAFFGLFILFSAFFLLKMINPELVKFDLPALIAIPETPSDLPDRTTLIPNLLGRIGEAVDQVKVSVSRIEKNGQEIKDLTDKCNCEIAQSLCVCDGGTDKSICRPLKVYSENENQPCPDGPEIKVKQKNIIAWNDEIVYYKNRATEEIKDLLLDIDELNRESNYYLEALKIENNPKFKEFFDWKIEQLSEEIRLKKELSDILDSLVKNIEKTVPAVIELSTLLPMCLSDLGNKCQANCTGNCHDIASGCQPEKPNSDNPCPKEDISKELETIKSSRSLIDSLSDQVLEKIKEIERFKTINI